MGRPKAFLRVAKSLARLTTFLILPTDMTMLCSREMVSMLAMVAIPLPSAPTSLASVPDSKSSAVGSCLVPSLFFIFATWIPLRAPVGSRVLR